MKNLLSPVAGFGRVLGGGFLGGSEDRSPVEIEVRVTAALGVGRKCPKATLAFE